MMSGLNKEIMEYIESRLDKGQQTYGQEVQLFDERNFVVEALEEALDMAVYLSAQLLRIKKITDNIGREAN